MVTGIMAVRGISITDLAQWEFTAAGQAIKGHGHLSVQGIERLVEFLSLPGVSVPGEPGEATTASARAEAPNPEQAKAEATRKYYKTVSGILDSFRPGPSLADSAGWLSRAAKRIDQLPGDNVDPDLLMWGADASSGLREAASILSTGQQRVRARTSAISVSTAYAQPGDYPDAVAAAQARADRENSRRQAAQAGAEERAAVTAEASKSVQAAMESRGKIRATMIERYGSGF